jgi:hypothetical protein
MKFIPPDSFIIVANNQKSKRNLSSIYFMSRNGWKAVNNLERNLAHP